MPDTQQIRTQITCRPIEALAPWARNARTHSKKQVRQIAASIRQVRLHQPRTDRRGGDDPGRPRSRSRGESCWA